MKRTTCWCLAAALSWGLMEMRAQAISGGRAQIGTVTEGKRNGRFQVPQVHLPDAVVARRINRRIIQLMLGEATDPTLSLSQQLGQAKRTCCYDAENGRGWNTVGQGLTGCQYQVLLNAHGLLSLELYREFTGAYAWESTEHATFDLRTGQVLTLADLVVDSPAQLTRRMHGAISRRLTAELAAMHTNGSDSADIAVVAERFCWDWSAKRVRFQSDPGPAEEARADEPDLENFALTPHELRLYYGPVLPHIALHLEPDNTYHFPYTRLQLRKALLPLTNAAPAKMH